MQNQRIGKRVFKTYFIRTSRHFHLFHEYRITRRVYQLRKFTLVLSHFLFPFNMKTGIVRKISEEGQQISASMKSKYDKIETMASHNDYEIPSEIIKKD